VSVRVYVPTTLEGLAGYHEAGEIPAGTDHVLPEGDDEDSEYDALMTAAAASAALAPPDGRRVVVVAEVPVAGAGVPMRLVVSVHCDTGDRPAGADPEDDLAWFATQEIPDLIRGVGGG
jgi:hypothetical protein